jgi:anti-sigma28 factor (negative regulator of flagellin synthesis)
VIFPGAPATWRSTQDVKSVGEGIRPIRGDGPRKANPQRLARIKAAIQKGEYETPEKLEATLRNLLAELRKPGSRLPK